MRRNDLIQSRRGVLKTVSTTTIGISVLSSVKVKASQKSDEELLTDILNDENIEYVEANPKKGFHHGYFIRRPKYPTLEAQSTTPPINVHSGLPRQDPTPNGVRDYSKLETKTAAATVAYNGGDMYQGIESGLCTLVPNIQPPSYNEYDGYTASLSHGTLEIADDTYKRLDLQLLAMIEHAREKINKQRKQVSEKEVIVSGYSANGIFGNRFALIHPDEVAAVITGGSSVQTVPTDEWNGREMPYGLGTSGLSELVDKEIDIEAYKNIPKFMFLNNGDTFNPIHVENFYVGLEYVAADIYPIESITGQWEKTQEIHDELNNNVTFKTYSQDGHTPQHPDARKDIAQFLQNNDIVKDPYDRIIVEDGQNGGNKTNTTNRGNSNKEKSESDDSTSNATSDTSPGFEIVTALSGIAGLGYVIRKRI